MFKSKVGGSLASKIAHTSTIPALGNKDLRLLQDLITNEKTVLVTLQKLAGDLTRASESLKSWGLGEGDDLGDILLHAAGMYAHISTALNNFANHQESVRVHLKSIRTKEEQLDELKRKRKSVAAKADAADKKLAKMSSENKNLPAQTDLLSKLRDEIRQLDTDIMLEEARLGDFKRLITRNFMALKLGGLLELGEKATIIGELGKLLIEEIPTAQTPPGQPRAFFQGQTKTANLASEASRCIGEVVLSAPADATLNPDAYAPPSFTQAPTLDTANLGRPSEDRTPIGESTYNNPLSPTESRLGSLAGPPTIPETATSPTTEFGETAGQRRFGTSPSLDQPRGGPGGGQFSTFPVKGRSNTQLSLGGDSFSASVVGALKLGDNGMDDNAGQQQNDNNAGRQYNQPPVVNVGGSPWDGNDYSPSHNRNASQDSTYLPYTQTPEIQNSYTSSSLSVEKGVRFRTPSMEVSGMTIAPGVASPTYPSTGGGWNGSSRGGTRVSSDVPASPVSPNIQEEDDGEYYNPYEAYESFDVDPGSPRSPVNDEQTRNASAARDIAREIDSMQFSPSSGGLSPSPQQQSFQPQSNVPSVRPLSIGRAPSPLVPPQPPFSGPRSVSPNYNYGPESPRISNPGGAISPMGSEPYATPPEYPTSPPSSTSTAPTGPRTISAAAFKRGGARLGSTGSDLDLSKKRHLPSSPYPAARSGHGSSASQDNISSYGRLPPGAQPPDYFGGQAPREPGSPDLTDYGSIGNTRIANDPPASPGYSQNQYVTRLDD